MTHPRISRFFSGVNAGRPRARSRRSCTHRLGPGAGEVGQLGADVGAVGGVQDVHELAQGELRRAEQRIGGERPIEVRLREPVHLRVDVGGAGAAVDLVHVEGVDVRDAEPAVAVGADEAVDGPAAVVRGAGRVRRDGRTGIGTGIGIGTGAGFAAAAVELGEERTPRGVAAVGVRSVAAVGVFEKRGARGEERRFAHCGPFTVGIGSRAAVYRIGFGDGYPSASALCEHGRNSARSGAPGHGRAGVPAPAGHRADRCPRRQGT